MPRGTELAFEVSGEWIQNYRDELEGNEDEIIKEARQIYLESLQEVRDIGGRFEGRVPDKYSPDISSWILGNPENFDTDPGRFLVAVSIVKGIQSMRLSVRNFEPEEELSWVREDILEVIKRITNGPIGIKTLAGEKTGASYLHNEEVETLSVKIVPSVPESYPLTLQPIMNYLSFKSDEYDLEGSIPHEKTHAFIDRNSETHHKEFIGGIMREVTGGDNYSTEHFAVDESAAQVVSYLITGEDIVTRGYEDRVGRERLHTLMQIYIRGVEDQDIGQAIANIRRMAVATIGYVNEGKRPENVLNALIGNEFSSDFENESLQTMAGTAHLVRRIQYEMLDYMNYIGVISNEKAYHSKEDLVESSTELLSNKSFLPNEIVESETDFHIEDMRRGIESLSHKDLNQEERRVLNKLQQDFKDLLAKYEGEKELLKSLESSEIRKEERADQEFVDLKQKFVNPEVTSPDQTRAFKKEGREVREIYTSIISDYKDVLEAVENLNLRILNILERMHKEESKERQIIEKYSLNEEEVINNLIKETEEDYERVKKGQEIIQDLEEKVDDVEGFLRELK